MDGLVIKLYLMIRMFLSFELLKKKKLSLTRKRNTYKVELFNDAGSDIEQNYVVCYKKRIEK